MMTDQPVFLTIVMPKGKTQKAFYKHLIKKVLPMLEGCQFRD